MPLADCSAAILVAAGSGRRLGAREPKAFVRLGDTPLYVLAARRLVASASIGRLVVVVPPGLEARAGETLNNAAVWACELRVVAGGAERQDSVRLGLAECGDCDLIVVHDAARPLASPALVERTLAAARLHGAALAALAASDTVKRAAADGAVEATLAREEIWLAQTPQAFRADLLRAAHARALAEGISATDDAMLVERLGTRVQIVPGEPSNRKITTADDLQWAEWWVGSHPVT